MKTNRRNFPRSEVWLPIVYQPDGGNQHKAYTWDISPTGMRLVVPEALPLGTRMNITISFKLHTARYTVSRSGLVIWAKQDTRLRGNYFLGIQFNEMISDLNKYFN